MSAPRFTVAELRARVTEKGPWFAVPKGRLLVSCRSCTAEVHWIMTKAGRSMPVDVAVPGGVAPTDTEDGRGVSHFATCPDSPMWRNSR